MEQRLMSLLEKLRQPASVQQWFGRMLDRWASHSGDEKAKRVEELQRQQTLLQGQQKRLMHLYTLGEISVEDFSTQNTEFRDRITAVQRGLEEGNVRRENVSLAQKVFELSQNLRERWVSANYTIKRQILEMVCLNFRLDGVTLVPEWRKPFDLLAEGLIVQSSQDNWTPLELFVDGAVTVSCRLSPLLSHGYSAEGSSFTV